MIGEIVTQKLYVECVNCTKPMKFIKTRKMENSTLFKYECINCNNKTDIQLHNSLLKQERNFMNRRDLEVERLREKFCVIYNDTDKNLCDESKYYTEDRSYMNSGYCHKCHKVVEVFGELNHES